MFVLHRFKLHRHLVDGTVRSVWFRQVFGLLRFSVYSGYGLDRFSVYSGYSLDRFSVFSGYGLDRFSVTV